MLNHHFMPLQFVGLALATAAIAPTTAHAQATPPTELTIRFILLANDIGDSTPDCHSRGDCVRQDQLERIVGIANTVFAPADVHFNFNFDHHFEIRRNSALNHNLQSNGSNWAGANTIAAEFPCDIVVFLRENAGSNFAFVPDIGQTFPTFAGPQTSPYPDFVGFVARDTQVDLWDWNFAHEIGHFLGLFHTHPTYGNCYPNGSVCLGIDPFPSTPDFDAAVAFVQANGGFDGDLINDTPEDPGPFMWNFVGDPTCDPAFPSQTRNGATYTPDQQNVMGYFYCGNGEHITAGQAAVVRQHVDDPFRARLQSCNIPPFAQCRDRTVIVDERCEATASIDDGSYDPDEDPLTCTQTPDEFEGVDVHTATLSCSDGTIDDDCEATVTTLDQSPPQFIHVPADITITECSGADIGSASASDNCGFVTITNDAPAKFPLGTTTVTWTAEDDWGNRSYYEQEVTAKLGDDPSCCPDGTRVVMGTSGWDVLEGDDGPDCILGLDGWDTINSYGGDDYISGGAGWDVITSGYGDDYIDGGSGSNTCFAPPGNDVVLNCL